MALLISKRLLNRILLRSTWSGHISSHALSPPACLVAKRRAWDPRNEAPRPPPCPAGGLLGDLFAFDPSSSLWTDLTPAGRGTAPPGPRAAHGFAWLDGGLYGHGGYGDGEPSAVNHGLG